MTVVDEINLLFRGKKDAESITLDFVKQNTVWGITYAFDDEPDEAHSLPEGTQLVFPLEGQSPKVLRVFFHFTNQSGTGGSYDLELTGSLGGKFSETPSVLQSGDLVPQNRYTFLFS